MQKTDIEKEKEKRDQDQKILTKIGPRGRRTTLDARMCLRWRRRLAAPEDKASWQEVPSEEEADRSVPPVDTQDERATK